MASKSLAFLTSMLAVVSASPSEPLAYVLPTTGDGMELPAPANGLEVIKIALGHGIQNYTCVDSNAPAATGALAVLYDITKLYPGTPKTGLAADVWNALSLRILWGQNIPLNLQCPSASWPGSPTSPHVLAESDYGAIVSDPFPNSPAGLSLPEILSSPAPFLGHHYFDAHGTPTFNLSSIGLFGSVKKTGDVKAPASASSGILSTGAVDWLQLTASDNGLSKGIKLVYRVITVGGASEICSVLDSSEGSVPYTAFYWFYG